jgi:hypothetical protein
MDGESGRTKMIYKLLYRWDHGGRVAHIGVKSNGFSAGCADFICDVAAAKIIAIENADAGTFPG